MTLITRRSGLLVAAGGAASLLLPAQAIAQDTSRGGGDWLALVRQHHQMIARAFDELLARNDEPYERRNLQLRNLDQLLTAHSLAEETVLYPALALAGLQGDAERLYMDEAHVKIGLARVELAAPGPRDERDWVQPARALRDAVLRHAREDEEARLFPQLHQWLEPSRNQALSQAYAREFSRVIPLNAR